jgi:hypothetical protein
MFSFLLRRQIFASTVISFGWELLFGWHQQRSSDFVGFRVITTNKGFSFNNNGLIRKYARIAFNLINELNCVESVA